jgi:hypothetical protein
MIGATVVMCCMKTATMTMPYPDKARMSLESIAIDVMGLIKELGLDTISFR